jgi:hypothetical protein
MSWSVVRAGGTKDAGNASSQVITVPAAGHAAGNLVVVVFGCGSDPTAASVSVADSKSNAYVVPVSVFANFRYIGLAYSKLTTALVNGDTITITLPAGADCIASSTEWNAANGVDLASGVLHADADQPNATAWASGTITPTAGRSVLLVAGDVGDNSGSNTPTAPWVERFDALGVTATRSLVVEEQIVASASGTYNGQGALSVQQDQHAVIVGFYETAAPSGPLVVGRVMLDYGGI